jgi:F420 biosynthesis protein FbiB-like protein
VLTAESSKERLAVAMGEEWRAQLQMDGQQTETVEARMEVSKRRLLESPVLILLCLYPEELDAYPDARRQEREMTMAVQSLGAAAQNMLLSSYSLGLDGGWMCAPLFCGEKVVEELDLDPALIPHALLTLGYAKEDPRRRPRKALDELVVHRDAK